MMAKFTQASDHLETMVTRAMRSQGDLESGPQMASGGLEDGLSSFRQRKTALMG